MGLISRGVDRLLHTVAVREPPPIRPAVREFQAQHAVIDLVVGTPLFRTGFLESAGVGHVDLPRLRAGGVDLVGFTIATRHPDLRGTLSNPHFRSLGLDVRRLRSNMALARALIERVHGWAAASNGALRLVRTTRDLEAVLPPSSATTGYSPDPGPRPTGAFLGIQGAHVLDGDLRNVERLHALGVRMLAPAHVMDNEAVGSNTGRRRGGLSDYGRELVAELERAGITVDLAHMSRAGIHDSVPLLTRPFALSHSGFRDLAGGTSWRRYSAGNRNVGRTEIELIASAGGLIGVTLSTALLGGEGLDAIERAFAYGREVAGPARLAIGSDLDGALRMIVDARGMPAITQLLLDGGWPADDVAAVIGGNAASLLRGALDRAEPQQGPIDH